MNRLGLFAFVLILGCEHFEGELLAPKEWIEIPGLEGRWDVPHTTDEPISIVKSAQAKEYRIVPRKGDVPGVVRFASMMAGSLESIGMKKKASQSARVISFAWRSQAIAFWFLSVRKSRNKWLININ
jgi:hypothetical protein